MSTDSISYRHRGITPRNMRLAAVLAIAFVLLNALAIYRYDTFAFSALPLVVLGAVLLVKNPRALLLVLVVATPLSFNFEDLTAFKGIGFYFPTEPILFVLMVLYLLKLGQGYRERREFMRHPLTVAIVVNLVWIAVTVLFSQHFFISLKFLVSRLWFVLVMYFMINHYFASRRYISNFVKAYIFSLSLVIIYTVSRHSLYGFSETAGHWVMWPFYKDHTSYGALIALFYPMVIFHLWRLRWKGFSKLLWLVIFAIFSVGLYYSYTRAAWVSLTGAAGVFMLIKLRIDFKVFLVFVGMVLAGFFAFQDEIIHNMEKNRQDSSDDITEHIRSITNISSDASNLERLNRWNSALKMFADKPLMGHGPGTYAFEYAKYQKSSDRTIISTNMGDGGNAHSEYLGPLSESGALGALTILAVMIVSLAVGIRLYYQLDHDPYLKGVVLAIVLGLVTYYLHGVLNNFLDTDKASVPVWGMMSILVAISIYHRRGRSLETAEK